METVFYIAMALIAILALWGLHRFLLWCEAKGWIYYLRRQSGGSGVGNALLSAQALFEPDRRNVAEAFEAEEVEQAEAEGPENPDEHKADDSTAEKTPPQ